MRKRSNLFLTLATAAALGLISAAPSIAQDEPGPREGQRVRQLDPSVKTTFVPLGNGEPGVLYEPKNPGPKAQIAIFSMHTTNDFLTHPTCFELSKRGYRVLCANDSNGRSGEFNDGVLDKVLLQAKNAIVFLRSYPGVKKIVLWGHSGGVTLMTSYQDIAENGVKVCQDDAKIYKCPDTLAGLPPADGVIPGDATWGVAVSVLYNMDPSVSDDNGTKINPDLDMYNPKNGYNPNGSSNYSPEFIHKYQAAQAKRNNELIDKALAREAAIKAGKGEFVDEESFIVPGGSFGNNKLHSADMQLFAHTEKAWPLLHKDGVITTEIVHWVRVPTGTKNVSPTWRAALRTTVYSYLGMYAIRATPDFGFGEVTAMKGVDWHSSISSNPGNVEGISVPFLTMGMTGSFESSTAETIHNHVKSSDKSLVYVEGATHGYGTCKKCETTPGQFGDTEKTLFDYIDGWLSKPGRFM
jgi:hypothetical protein